MAKRILPVITLLFAAVMLFSAGMIIKETDECRQDISDFEKLEDLITETEQLITLSPCYGNAKDDRIIIIGVEQKESSRIAS